MYLNLQSMMLWNKMAPKGNLWVFPNLVEKNTLLCFICITFKTMPMTDKGQTGWYMLFYWRWNLGEQWLKGLCLCLKITFKTLLQTLWSLESPLVLVLHLRVIFIGIPKGRQATIEAALRQAVNITVHPLHGITEGQRVTVLIHVGRAGWSGNKGEDCYTWGLVILKMTQQWNQRAMQSRPIFLFLPRAVM